MKRNNCFKKVAAGICLVGLSGWTSADVGVPDFADLSQVAAYTQGSGSYMVALNESGVVISPSDAALEDKAAKLLAQQAEFEPPMFSGSNAHKLLGLGTLALVAVTALTAPDEDEGATVSTKSRTQGTHQSLGRLTAAMAAAAVTTGLLAHWDDFHLEDGLTDPDNLHVMLGALGAMLMLNTVSKAPESGHPATGIAGGVAMGAAIKLTW